jgi:signal transduction histidine kinase
MGLFFEHNIVLVYFTYGLAFFCMGLAVWLESGHTAEFRMARAMGPLAGFGIVHGLHEWFEMFQRLGRAEVIRVPAWLLRDELHLIHLAVSFILLINFGIRLIYYSRQENDDADMARNQGLVRLSVGALLAVWLISLIITRALYKPEADDFLRAVDVLTRYILGVPGALLAAWAIVLEQQTFSLRGMSGTGRDLLRAALALFFYGILGQTFPNQSFLFPSTIVNSDLFFQLFGIPIQLFRAMTAAIMAIFVIRALRAFELESQQQLQTAQRARLAAQQEALTVQEQARLETEALNRQLQVAYQELQVREALRRDLLHQAVTAQEQERQRIARDLHDTTGQALTALGLGFAAVGESVQNNPELATNQLDKLKKLSMQALEELRDLIGNLRPSVLDDLGLVPALQGHVKAFESHCGIQTHLALNGRRRRLPPEVETTVFRIVQEALTNVARHSAARHVTIELDFQPDRLRLLIEDDGRGFDPQTAYHPPNGRRPWGLLGMQERVNLVNGQYHLRSAPGRGTAIEMIIPLEQEGESLNAPHPHS